MGQIKELTCAACGKHMALLRDARVRRGMVVYCTVCDLALRERRNDDPGMLDFIRGLFGGRKL